MTPVNAMLGSGNGSDPSSLMTFGVALPGEALMSSESPAASPGAVESPVGLIPTQSLPGSQSPLCRLREGGPFS